MFASFNRPDWRGGAVERGSTRLIHAIGLSVLLAVTAAAQTNTNFIDAGPPPDDPMTAIKRLMAGELVDPEAAQYRFLGVHPAKCKAGWAKGGSDWIGYAVGIEINGKNRMGGYTGFTPYTILFEGQNAWRSIEGSNFGAYGPAKGLLGLGGGAGVCRYLD